MPLRPAIFCALLVLAGCAARTEPPPAPKAQAAPVPKAQAAPVPAGVPGVILAMRPVAPENPEPAHILLAGLGTPDAFAHGQVFEFIVRTDSGAMISIVQPRTGGLHAGEHVSILRGAETRIDAPASD